MYDDKIKEKATKKQRFKSEHVNKIWMELKKWQLMQ